MTEQIILDFFERFRSDVTESIFAVKGIQDYQKLKTYYDYLDYDRSSIYRTKKDLEPCGLRNIGNTCYLNAILQMLYHISFLREKIFSSSGEEGSVLSEIRHLFGRLQVGRLAYADPTDLFEALKKNHPDIFVEGVQNDFHEICTLLLDQLKESLNKSSEKDGRLIDKMLFGKMAIKTIHSEGKTQRHSRFNIINLNSAHGNLDNALEQWKNYEIDDFLTENNKHVKALVETQFVETPALMTFFINRVSFKDNQLVKDNSEFKFDETIYLSKSAGTRSGMSRLTKSFSTKEGQLEEHKEQLSLWIKSISEKKVHLQQTLKYVSEKEFTNINAPQIENKFEEKSQIKEYLEEELKQIDAKIEESKKEQVAIQERIDRLFEENQTEMYVLWGMMIHEGTNPNSGHYKVVINTQPGEWTEFNDRKIENVTQERIEKYSQKGQICCLLYRRPSLVGTSSKVSLPISLKGEVFEIEKHIMSEIDKARVLQNLHQLSETSAYLYENQMNQRQQNRDKYFFKPIMHCFSSHFSFPQCQGLLIYESLKDEANVQKLNNSFLLSDTELKVPQINFEIPQEYYLLNETFKTFIKKELNIQCIGETYQWLSEQHSIRSSQPKNEIIRERLQRYLEIIIMKGVFYLCVISRLSIGNDVTDKFYGLLRAVESLMERINPISEFTLTYIPIKDEVKRLFVAKSKSMKQTETSRIVLRPLSNAYISKMIAEDEGQLYKARFRHWIEQREKLNLIDESIIEKEKKMQLQFVLELN